MPVTKQTLPNKRVYNKNIMSINKSSFLGRIKRGVKSVGSAYKNLPANVTQKSRFKKDIKQRATIEADKISKKIGYKGAKAKAITVYSKDPSLMTKKEKANIQQDRNIRIQVRKVRKAEAKRKKII